MAGRARFAKGRLAAGAPQNAQRGLHVHALDHLVLEPLGAGRGPISTALQTVVLAARAARVPAFDGVFNQLTDSVGLEAECRDGRMLGFDGKSLIHPDQIALCHEAFAPTEVELDRARRLIDAATGGAERFEDAMIERMHVEAAERLLAKAGR